MSQRSGIEWTEHTWNVVVGCQKVSAGCLNCYAARYAHRLGHNPGKSFEPYRGLARRVGDDRYAWTGLVRTVPERLAEPLGWGRSARVFVCSMSDLFHDDVPADFIRRVFGVMLLAPWHTFQVLTKRPERMAALAPRLPWPGHVWAGVSVEDQKAAWRVDVLRRVPAAVRWVSAEPLLGPVDLDLTGIGWVVTGGESGPGYRPLDPAWARALREQCRAAKVKFFHKQNGGPHPRANGRELDGQEYSEMPAERPRPVPPLQDRRRLAARVSATPAGRVALPVA